MKTVVHRADLDRNPYLGWNAFIRFLATAEPEQFDASQCRRAVEDECAEMSEHR